MSKQKTIVVTGASQRLGLFLCQQFLQQNDNVVAITRSPSRALNELQNDRLSIFSVPDYAEPHLQHVIDAITQRYTQIDALIHNASLFAPDPADDFTNLYTTLIHLHMVMPTKLNMGLQPLLTASADGNIIHITDIYAENPKHDHILYCSTKAGLENLTKGFAKKFAPHIRVNSIQPGPIQFLDEHSQQHKDDVLAQTLVAKEGGFLPVYKAVKSLLDNDYITGAAIKVDGGRAIGRG